MARIFFDTEFIEDRRTIDLISIGMVKENGVHLYMQSRECDLNRAGDWVKQHVFPHLRLGAHYWHSREYIASAVLKFAGDSPVFWAYYADYDWVALCQLFGRMVDLPPRWPRYCRDLKQAADFFGKSLPPQPEAGAHDALANAMWAKMAYGWLDDQVSGPLMSVRHI